MGSSLLPVGLFPLVGGEGHPPQGPFAGAGPFTGVNVPYRSGKLVMHSRGVWLPQCFVQLPQCVLCGNSGGWMVGGVTPSHGLCPWWEGEVDLFCRWGPARSPGGEVNGTTAYHFVI